MNNVPANKWATTVKARSDYTCEICWCTDVRMEAHHILPVSLFPDRALDVDNGLCLCHDCHYLIHGCSYDTNKRYNGGRYIGNNPTIKRKEILVKKLLQSHPNWIYWDNKQDKQPKPSQTEIFDWDAIIV
jgi:hypothetical protein